MSKVAQPPLAYDTELEQLEIELLLEAIFRHYGFDKPASSEYFRRCFENEH